MVNSELEQEHWHVAVEMHFERKQYVMGRITLQLDQDPGRLGPYLLVKAQDEIGAFNVAQKILNRLQLHPAP